MTEMTSKDLRKDIAGIQVPTLVLAAFMRQEQYPQFTKDMVSATYGEQYKACGQCMVHVSDNAKHFIMYDAPEWFYGEIDEFLKSRH